MNWTGGTLNRHSHAYRYGHGHGNCKGKGNGFGRREGHGYSYGAGGSGLKRRQGQGQGQRQGQGQKQKGGQAYLQRLHFARLREMKMGRDQERERGRWMHVGEGTGEDRREGEGEGGDGSGGEGCSSIAGERLRGFVPEWARAGQKRMGRMVVEGDGISGGGYDEGIDGVDGVESESESKGLDGSVWRRRVGRKTLREYEDDEMAAGLVMGRGVRMGVGEKIGGGTDVKGSDYGSSLEEEDEKEEEEEEEEEDEDSRDDNDGCISKGDEILDRKRYYLLRCEDWAGLQHCYLNTPCSIGRRSRRRKKGSRKRKSSDGSDSINNNTETSTHGADKDKVKRRKRKRHEPDESHDNRCSLTQPAHSNSKSKLKYDKRPSLNTHSSTRHIRTRQVQRWPLPPYQVSYRRRGRRSRYMSTEVKSVDGNINDDDISVRIGSDALASETSRPYTLATSRKKEKNEKRQGTTETEGFDGSRNESDDSRKGDSMNEDSVRYGDDSEVDYDDEQDEEDDGGDNVNFDADADADADDYNEEHDNDDLKEMHARHIRDSSSSLPAPDSGCDSSPSSGKLNMEHGQMINQCFGTTEDEMQTLGEEIRQSRGFSSDHTHNQSSIVNSQNFHDRASITTGNEIASMTVHRSDGANMDKDCKDNKYISRYDDDDLSDSLAINTEYLGTPVCRLSLVRDLNTTAISRQRHENYHVKNKWRTFLAKNQARNRELSFTDKNQTLPKRNRVKPICRQAPDQRALVSELTYHEEDVNQTAQQPTSIIASDGSLLSERPDGEEETLVSCDVSAINDSLNSNISASLTHPFPFDILNGEQTSTKQKHEQE